MIYKVYTDAAVGHEEHVATVAYLILSEDTLIAYDSKLIRFTESNYAEVKAIECAIDCLKSARRLNSEDKVELHTDSHFASVYLNAPKTKLKELGSDINRVITCWDLIDALKSECQVEFFKEKAHTEFNTHYLCDRLAHYKLLCHVGKEGGNACML